MPPSRRGRLHDLAAAALELLPGDERVAVLPEIARHLQLALRWSATDASDYRALAQREVAACLAAATLLAAQFRFRDANELWDRVATSVAASDADRVEALVSAAEACEPAANHEEGLRLAARALAVAADGDVPLAAQVRAHAAAGVCALRLERLADAETHLARAAELAVQTGSTSMHARAVGNLANLHMVRNQLDLAEAGYLRSFSLAQAAGDRALEGVSLANHTLVQRLAGRLENAETNFLRCREIAREVGNRRAEGMSEGHLGLLYTQADRLLEALARFDEAIAIAREVGNRRDEAVARGNLADVYRRLGRLDEAAWHAADAIALHRMQNNARAEAVHTRTLGIVRHEAGDNVGAEALLRRSLEILVEINDLPEARRSAHVLAEFLVEVRPDDPAAHAEAEHLLAKDGTDEPATK
jgi:tetratricopeptide (TPR) repeat protein